ncbi:MAG: MotA/TolQ/ExbB proton channel family protein [Bdellovibrionales bacterium]|nr:MotA/TolQ/ExbB proton channel family protein [Bdellovibrionales bacterium]
MIKELLIQYNKGGVFMHFILITSFIGLAIAIERFIVLWAAAKINKEDLLKHINNNILQGNLQGALSTTSQINNPLTNIIRAGIAAVANRGTPEEVQTAMDAVALREVPRLEKRIGLLATLSNIATLLGLLGTVVGLIGAFAAVANVAPAEKATMLSNAIATAMNTTAFGLIVAIPLLGAFGYLNNMVQGIVDDMHESSVATLNFILTHKDKLMRK